MSETPNPNQAIIDKMLGRGEDGGGGGDGGSVDWDNTLRYLGGGVLAGGGLASLYHYIRNFQKLSDEVEESEEDQAMEDNASRRMLSLDKPAHVKEAFKDDALNKFLRWTAAGGGLVGGYFGVKEIYDRVKQKQLDKELEDAQDLYMDSLHAKREKEQNKYACFDKEASGATGTAVATTGIGLLMLALASGIITNKTLEESYPSVKPSGKKDSLGRRNISVRRKRRDPLANETPSDSTVIDENGDEVKTVSSDKSNDSRDDAEEVGNLIRMTTADDQVSKKAGFDDLINAVALGRCGEIKENIPYGIDHVFDTIKGSGLEKVSSVSRELAIELLSTDPMLKEAFAPLFAAEYYNMSPYLTEAAGKLGDEEKEELLKMARTFNSEVRRNFFLQFDGVKQALEGLEKNSSSLDMPNKDLQEILAEGHGFISSGVDSEEDESEEDSEEDAAALDIDEEPDDQPDIIDKILS